MAINLNPGADVALVTSATRAGMATAPADYSKTLESVVKGYEKTMQAQSKMWGDVAKLGVNIGKEMMANAQEYASAAAKAGGLDPEGATFLINEIYGNKDAQKALGWGLFDDRETRQERTKLKMEQANLFADIDAAVESINTGSDAIANGLYDATINEVEAEKVNAIIKSNLKDKNTENGNYAKLGRDEKTGELIYTLYDSNTNKPTILNGEPQTMTIKEFNQSITNNVKDTKNVVGTSMGTIINDIATSAQKGKSGVIDKQTIQLGLNRLDNTLTTDTDWKRAMGAKFGLQNTSFIDDLTSEGVYSADLYGNLLQTLGLSKDGQVPAEGVFEGIEDTDNVLGLSLPEINAAYTTYVSNIKNMKDPEASKAAFKDAFTKRMGGAHTWGYGKRTITPISGKNPFGTKNIEFASEEGGQKLYKTSTKALADRDAILNNQPFQGIYGDYSVGTDSGYMLNGEPISQYDALIQEKVNLMGDRADRLGGSNIGGRFTEAKDLSPYFGPNANEENAVSKLKEVYPNLKISSPVGMREKIKVNGETFYLRGKGKSTPEMEMKRLQDFIKEITGTGKYD